MSNLRLTIIASILLLASHAHAETLLKYACGVRPNNGVLELVTRADGRAALHYDNQPRNVHELAYLVEVGESRLHVRPEGFTCQASHQSNPERTTLIHYTCFDGVRFTSLDLQADVDGFISFKYGGRKVTVQSLNLRFEPGTQRAEVHANGEFQVCGGVN